VIRRHAGRLTWTGVFCAVALLVAATTAATSSAAPKAKPAAPITPTLVAGDARIGRDKAESERCLECHVTARHNVTTEGRFAKLTGQVPEYMVKQIRNFRSGERRHDFMAIMARSIDDADAADIAAFFAEQEPMQGDGSGDNAAARALYERGDAARQIVACVQCHGERGKGTTVNGVRSPVIGGQEARYIEKQLLDWRSGERRNSADGAMNRVTKALTDSEIQALSDYLAGL